MDQRVSFEHKVIQHLPLLSNVIGISIYAKTNANEHLGDGLLSFGICGRVLQVLVKFLCKVAHGRCSQLSCTIRKPGSEIAA